MSERRASKPDGARVVMPASETLTEQAYAGLEELIVTLQLKPGEVLSEHAMAEKLGLGRTPIREALQRLAREGLVIVLPRRGILVAEADPRAQLLVLEVRRELERLLCRLAAERATPVERDRLIEIAKGMDLAAAAADDLAFMRLDRALNELITEAAHNIFAARALRMVQGHSRRFWFMHYEAAADLPLCASLHAAQARAIAEGHSAKAAAASDRLLDYVETFARSATIQAIGIATAG